MSIVEAPSTARIDGMFRAFADETRLRILHLLVDGELCVSDIVDILGIPQAKASHHLIYLRKAGLVQTRKNGLWCFYSLSPARSGFHGKLLECLDQCLADAPELVADRRLASRVRKSGGCCPR